MRIRTVVWGSLVLVLVAFAIRFWWLHATTHDTFRRFIQNVYEGHIDEARAMVAADDLATIPDWYWDDLRQTDFGDHKGYAFTGAMDNYLRHEFPFWFHTSDGDEWVRDGRVLWVADGDVIRVAVTEFHR